MYSWSVSGCELSAEPSKSHEEPDFPPLNYQALCGAIVDWVNSLPCPRLDWFRKFRLFFINNIIYYQIRCTNIETAFIILWKNILGWMTPINENIRTNLCRRLPSAKWSMLRRCSNCYEKINFLRNQSPSFREGIPDWRGFWCPEQPHDRHLIYENIKFRWDKIYPISVTLVHFESCFLKCPTKTTQRRQ